MSDFRNRLLTRVVAPAEEPLSLEETKLYLRVIHDDENLLLADAIVAVRMTAEQWLKRSLITQSWKLAYDNFVHECTPLPMGPINNITSVSIVNRNATTQVINNALYYLNAAQDTIVFQSALIGFKIEIVYSTGYGNAAAVPRPIKQGMLAHIASMFDYRGETHASALPAQTIALYMPYRGVSL